jgi:RHS repeat-associated protein
MLITSTSAEFPFNSVLEDAIALVHHWLRQFSQQSDFVSRMIDVYGQQLDHTLLTELTQAWKADNFSQLPDIEIRPQVELNGANGAYAAATNQIYLAQELLTIHNDRPQFVGEVLLEEIGHAIDAQLNAVDSPGDEGAIFAAMVQGRSLTPLTLEHLRAEDDTAILTLEDQTIQVEQAAITWIGGDGDWYDPANWSIGTVPTANDDVTVDRPTENITITFSEGEPVARSLSLLARDGAVLTLEGLTRYTGPRLNISTFIEANGPGSHIDLSSLTTLTGTTGLFGAVNINAVSGGTVDLSLVNATPDGFISIVADGDGSKVDLSSLTQYGNANRTSSLTVRNGGTLAADTLTDLERVTLSLDGTGNFDTAQIARLTGGALTVDGFAPDFSQLANIDRSSISVTNGGSLALPAVTSYTGPTNNVSPVLEANGIGSELDLSALKTLTGTTGLFGAVNINAVSGGTVDLSEIHRVVRGRTQVLADGQDSDIQLSNLATNDLVTLSEQNGGAIALSEPSDLENLGLLGISQTVSDFVGAIDPSDLFKFELGTPRDLGFLLTEIGTDVANAELLDDSGNLLTSVTILGSETLSPGTYYVWVYQPTAGTDYNLELSTAGIPDGAGNTLATARNLGVLDTPQSLEGSVGDSDAIDIYRFQVTESNDFTLTLGGLSADADVQLLDINGALLNSSSRAGTTAEDIITELNAGVYYAQVDRHTGNTNYTLDLSATPNASAPFQISGVTPDAGSNAGIVTLTVSGNQFTPTASLRLIAPDGSDVTPTQQWWQNDMTLVGNFDLTGLATGAYDVQVVDAPGTVVIADGFSLDEGPPGQLEAYLTVPDTVRSGQPGEVTVTYRNTGNTDIVAPLMSLAATGGQLQGFDGAGFTASSVQFLGINDEGAAGILSPGASGSLAFQFQPDSNAVNVNFSLQTINEELNIDWETIKADTRPELILDEAWDAIWENFTASVQSSGQTYNAVLAENATHLSQLGEYTPDVVSLLAFELWQSSNNGSLTDQYSLGALGRGRFLLWEITARSDSEGNVAVGYEDSFRYFQRQEDGTYQPATGDYGTLTLENGSYRLREPDGTIAQFLPDGKLDFIEDTNGKRVQVTYTGDRLTQVTDTNGYSLDFEYNAQGRVSQVTDDAGRFTTYTYDASGETLLTVTDPLLATTTYTYNSDFSIDTVTLDDGTQATYTYDAQGRVIETSLTNGAEPLTYTYDATGKVTATDANGDSSQFWQTASGQIRRLQDPLNRILEFVYDEDDNLVQLTAPDNTVSSFTYDDRGNLLMQVDPRGYRVQFTYEPTFDQLTSVRDEKGNPTTYSYDDRGNLTAITYADGSAEAFSYGGQGNLTQWVNRRGEVIDYTYDSNHQLATYAYANTPQVDFSYDYDAVGNLTAATDATGTIDLGYDNSDRLTDVTDTRDRQIEYRYDTVGHLTQLVYPDGYAVNYGYDEVGRLQSLTDGTGATLVEYRYDAVGRLAREDKGNGTYTTYDYDAAGQVTAIVHYAPDDAINASFVYTYDRLGRRTTMTTLEGTWEYGYDATGQLIAVTTPEGRDITYDYDPAGNRNRVTDDGTATNYNTNALNQYTSVAGETYRYDADGNLIEPGNDTLYTYDDENRLIQVVTSEGTWDYEYDALGNRTASIYNGVRTEYLIDPTGLGNVLAEYDSDGNLIARYIHGLGLETRLDASNSTHYYDFDALGSTTGLTDATGDYLNTYRYLPFGEELAKTETIDNPFEYVGQWGVMDEANDLDFIRARFYSPVEGRFLNADPIGQAGGINVYQYTTNDPINTLDLSGLQGFRENLNNLFFPSNSPKNDPDAPSVTSPANLPPASTDGEGDYQDPAGNIFVPTGNTFIIIDRKLLDNLLSKPRYFEAVGSTASYEPFGDPNSPFYNPNPEAIASVDPFLLKDIADDITDSTACPVPTVITTAVTTGTVLSPLRTAASNENQSCDEVDTASISILPEVFGDTANTWGDPHLTTFDRKSYDFQAAGEFILVQSSSGDLEIQVRQEPLQGRLVSLNTAAATVVDGQRVGFYAKVEPLVSIDGTPTALADGESVSVGGGRIIRNANRYTLLYPSGDQVQIVFSDSLLYGKYLSLNLALTGDHRGNLVGLLGSNNGIPDDDFALRDGTVLGDTLTFEQLYGEYADSWRITRAESLFDYGPGEDTTTYTDTSFPSSPFTIDDLTPAQRAAAEQIAQELGITDPTLLANAILDIALTDGDTAFVEGAATQNRTLIATAGTTLIGPSGVGAQGWLVPAESLAYTIYFENPAAAGTAIATATLTQQLDPDLDWASLQLGDLGFGDIVVDVPDGRQSYSTRLDRQDDLGVFVDVSGKLDATTGELSWTFITIDPQTGAPVTDPALGFLPPNNAEGNGTGFVSYRLQPQPDAPTGTAFDAIATVTLGDGAPINTLMYRNTSDRTPPTSAVNPLPATTATETFTVTWSGSDTGSGVETYDVYIAINGGAFEPWLEDTPATSAMYPGTAGQTYAFYSVARDLVGQVEAAPGIADAVTTVAAPTLAATAFDVTNDHVLLGEADLVFTLANQGTATIDGLELAVVYSDDDLIGNGDDQTVGTYIVTNLLAGELVADGLLVQLPQNVLNSRAQADDSPGMGANHVSSSYDMMALVTPAGDVLAIDDITYFPWDLDDSGQVTPSDAIYIINRLGQTTTADNALADCDGSGQITPSDAIAAINRLGYRINTNVIEPV